jgi:hypothetical protein
MRSPLFGLAAAALCLLPGVARAQSADGFDASPDDRIAGDAQAAAEKGDAMPGEKPKEAAPEPPSEIWNTAEDPMKTYYFVDLRFRDVIVPKFMIDLFADGGSTVNVFTFGPELSRRKDNMEIDFALSYADYSMNPFLFKGHSDGPESYELVSSSMKVLYLTFDLLYDIPLDSDGRYSLLIGGGVGLGGVWGDLYRSQVYPAAGNTIDPDNPSSARKCSGPSASPSIGGKPYCDASNNHYGSYSEPSWAHGGSKPIVFPWISLPQISFRVKPLKWLQTRVDTGFSITGFYFGMSAGYALPVGGNASDAKH